MRSANGTTDALPKAGAERAPTAAWRVAEWAAIPRLAHGFLGRAHGLGPNAFDLDLIRARLAAATGEAPRAVLAARQVHGATVLSPEDPAWSRLGWNDSADRLPAGDALVSASAELMLTVRTADCVPVLLVAPAARAVAAVHAGWRGLLAGVVERSVAALAERYGAPPAAIEAAIGPAIGGCCYEFGAEHHRAFVARYGAAAEAAWRGAASGRGHLDLRALTRVALTAAGIGPPSIRTLGPCTVHDPDALHSYRRDGAGAGRQLSYIGWRAD